MWRTLSCVQFRTSGLRRQALPKAELSGGCSELWWLHQGEVQSPGKC
jgi:hypothetical protein